MLDVILYTPEKVVFEGQANRIVFPGEQGVFETLPYHRPLISRLVSGKLIIDEQVFSIRCGIAAIKMNRATIVVEL
jgi:F-type H+-transporting ATPase subunit epsilon